MPSINIQIKSAQALQTWATICRS